MSKPNILFVITDHHAYHGHYGETCTGYRLPRFEQLCAEGVRFERAYSACPLCTPARASMMSGMYPSRHGLRWNTEYSFYGNIPDFRQGQQLYSHYLAGAGYRNAYVGKWHCGAERLPVDYGMEGWSLPLYGDVYGSDEYRSYALARGFPDPDVAIDWHVNRPEWRGRALPLSKVRPGFFEDGSGVLHAPEDAHESQFIANLTTEKIRELSAGNQPWSLVASFWGPHQPYYPTEPYASMVPPESISEYPSFRDDLSGRPFRHLFQRDLRHRTKLDWTDWSVWQQVLSRCYGQAMQTDAAVGRILDALAESGQADDTLVIWCADHGDSVASHGGQWDKGPHFSEETARIPLAIRWPCRLASNVVSEELVSNMDVTATMLAAAGVGVPADMQSRSLLGLCGGAADGCWPGFVVCEHNGHHEDALLRMVVEGRYKYVASVSGDHELYDLEADPYEMKNLARSEEHADVAGALRMRIADHVERNQDVVGERLAYAIRRGY
jgi:arylsulfatase A-like enzyme